MKRNSMLIVASTLIVMASACSLEITPTLSENEKNVKTVDITIVANDKPAVEAEVATKTYIDGAAIKWSNSGEKLKVWEVATPAEGELVTSSKVSSEGVTEDSGSTMSFAVSMEDKSSGYTNFDYYAVYPSSAYQTGSVVTSIALNTTAAQTPSSTNFDPSHDLLIAKKIANGGSQASGLSMQFARVVAIGKMNVKNLGSSEDITKITFSAKIGDTPVAIAGRTTFDLNTAKPTTEYGSNTKDYSIILNYEGQNIQANTAEGMVAYFTCYPFAINSETPGSFKVVVETATKTFTKEVSVSSAKGLAFNIGKASVFSVDMDGIEGQDRAVDLCYAYLAPTDVSLAASYGNASITKPHGDKWSMYACLESGTIGVRRNDKGNNDSYIKLPDFVNDIKTVVVTLNSPASEKTITLENSATATTGTIAQLATTGATVYTFDLTSVPSVKTAYFRSSGAQAKVEKIEVYAGTDSRTELEAPATVVAVRNTDDEDITNVINVTWGSVVDAISYEVTLTPTSGASVVHTVNGTSDSFTGLDYSMSYTPSVIAIADPYSNLNSPSKEGSPVSTESAPFTDLLNVSLTGAENTTYIDWNGKSSVSSAVYAGNSANNYSAIQLRASNSSGIISTESGGLLTKVIVNWNPNTTSGRSIKIFGKNIPYNSTPELYNANSRGTLIGTLTYDGANATESVNVDTYYEYIGLLAEGGAEYLNEIRIKWKSPKTRISSPTSVSASSTGSTINVTWTDVASGVYKYLVTCTGKPEQLINPGVQAASFTDMANGSYDVSIRAIPADNDAYSYSTIQTVKNVVVASGPIALMTLDMTTKSYGTSAYNTTTDYGNWKIQYGANNNKGWAYFKMGGKSSTISSSNPCAIYTTLATSRASGSVVVHIPSGSLSKSGMSVNSWGVYVYSDKSLSTLIDTAKGGGTITGAEGTFTFTPSDGYGSSSWPSGSYFKVSWDLANTTTTNGIVCVDKITIYEP